MEIPEEFADYARRATAGVDGGVARRAARDELLAHLLDARQNALDAGASEEESVRRALERMGGADELVRPLERATTPRWRPTVVAGLVLAALLVVIALWLVLWLAFWHLTSSLP